MFKKRIFTLIALLCSIAFFMCFHWIRISDADVKEYKRLLEKSDQAEKAKVEDTLTARQLRHNVSKDILFANDVARLHFRFRAKNSELIFSDNGEHTEMVEQMKDVRCFIQEELFYRHEDGRELVQKENGQLLFRNADPEEEESWYQGDRFLLQAMQKIRYMEADDAVFYYKNNSFVTKEVNLQRLVAHGHNLSENLEEMQALMKGTASAVEFTLGGKTLNFKAHHLKATLFSPKGLL